MTDCVVDADCHVAAPAGGGIARMAARRWVRHSKAVRGPVRAASSCIDDPGPAPRT